MKTAIRFGIVVLLFIGLVAVRFFEDALFYDPLDRFFHGDFKTRPLPDLNFSKLSLSLFLRYLINTVLSLAIIFTVLTEKKYVIFAAVIYAVLFVVLYAVLSLFILAIEADHMWLFYVRRVLIHPLMLFVLLPALYYQSRTKQGK